MLNGRIFYAKMQQAYIKIYRVVTFIYTLSSITGTGDPTLIVAFSELCNNVNYSTFKLFVSKARIKFRIFLATPSIENKQIDKRQTISFQFIFL